MYRMNDLDKITNDNSEKIYTFCRSRINDKETSYDITQDVFNILCENWHDLETHPKIEAWLMTTAKNKMFEYQRELNKEKSLRNDTIDLQNIIDRHENHDSDELHTKKVNLLNEIKTDDMELIDLIYVKKLKYKEVADLLHTSEGAIKMRVNRLKKRMYKKLTKILYSNILLIVNLLECI